MYLSVFADCPLLLNFLHWLFLSHSQPFPFHFPHNFPCLLIVKLIQFISFPLLPVSLFLFSLLFLLHDYFITDNFLHDLSR